MPYISDSDLDFSYERAMELLKSGKLKLGIRPDVADILVQSDALRAKLQRPVASSPDTIWTIVSVLVVLVSVLASILDDWWYFMIGLIVGAIIFLATRKGNAEKLIELAKEDQQVFEDVRRRNSWIFHVRRDAVEELRK
ncbi:hypothetical protein AAFN47_16250 [Hoeflea sp. CAU 1731]